VVEVQGQRGVDIGRVCWRKSRNFYDCKVAFVCSPNAHIAMSRGGAAGLPGKCCDVGLDARDGVETVDIIAAGIVDEVGFGGADEVPQLVVSAPVSERCAEERRRREELWGGLTRWESW
jgi:hypothetical protein